MTDNIKQCSVCRDMLVTLKRVEHLAKNAPVFSDLLPSIRAAIAAAESKL